MPNIFAVPCTQTSTIAVMQQQMTIGTAKIVNPAKNRPKNIAVRETGNA